MSAEKPIVGAITDRTVEVQQDEFGGGYMIFVLTKPTGGTTLGPYGAHIWLRPAAARRLAARLLRAAERCEKARKRK